MNELLHAVADGVAAEGAEVSFATDRYPREDEPEAYVAIPHEFFPLALDNGGGAPRQLGRTIGFCVEQPGTRWFGTTWHYGKQLGARMDIRRSVARYLTRNGVPTEHFQLGYHAAWDCWRRDEGAQRAIDVLYLGSHDDRRARMLAHYTATLQGRSVKLLIPPEAPKPAPRLDYLVGPGRRRARASARALLNVHRGGVNRFEWLRVLESICNGCVIVSEHSVDTEPLVAGAHFLSGAAENLALLAAGLLDDEPRLAEMRLRAYGFIRSELPMRSSAQRLLAIAEGLARKPARRGKDARLEPEPAELAAEPAAGSGSATDPLTSVRAALKQISLDTAQLGRRLQALELGTPWADARRSVAVVAQSPTYARSEPRVTVAIPLYKLRGEGRRCALERRGERVPRLRGCRSR
jgi:hypothetical protein